MRRAWSSARAVVGTMHSVSPALEPAHKHRGLSDQALTRAGRQRYYESLAWRKEKGAPYCFPLAGRHVSLEATCLLHKRIDGPATVVARGHFGEGVLKYGSIGKGKPVRLPRGRLEKEMRLAECLGDYPVPTPHFSFRPSIAPAYADARGGPRLQAFAPQHLAEQRCRVADATGACGRAVRASDQDLPQSFKYAIRSAMRQHRIWPASEDILQHGVI